MTHYTIRQVSTDRIKGEFIFRESAITEAIRISETNSNNDHVFFVEHDAKEIGHALNGQWHPALPQRQRRADPAISLHDSSCC